MRCSRSEDIPTSSGLPTGTTATNNGRSSRTRATRTRFRLVKALTEHSPPIARREIKNQNGCRIGGSLAPPQDGGQRLLQRLHPAFPVIRIVVADRTFLTGEVAGIAHGLELVPFMPLVEGIEV